MWAGVAGPKTNQIWWSDDEGVNWTQVTVTPPQWSARAQGMICKHNVYIYMVGGIPGTADGQVWVSLNTP